MDLKAREEWSRNWRVVVGASAGMALLAVPTYTNGVMVLQLEKAFGWSRAQIATGPVIAALLSIFMGPVVGLAVDKIGPRRIGLTGATITCMAIAMFSFTGPTFASWLGLWFLLSLGTVLIKPMVWTAGVSSFFNKARGLALAAALCGTAFCSSITPLLTTVLVEQFGWRGAYVGLAVFWGLVALLPLYFWFDSKIDRTRRLGLSKGPQDPQAQQHQDVLEGYTTKTSIMSWKYLRLVLGAQAMVFVTVSFVVLLVPILVSKGTSPQLAGSIAALAGITTVVGRLLGGVLLDRLNGNAVTACAVALPAISAIIVLMYPASVLALGAAVLVLGLAAGAEYDGVAYLITRHFGLRSFGVLFGTIGGLQAMFSSLGPLVVNRIYDVTRSYDQALYLFIPVCIFGSVMILTLGSYPSDWRERPA